MSNWNIKTPTLIILGGLIFLMLLILVLPDVDLPDTAFHRGTAPVVVHAQVTSAPPAVIVAVLTPIHSFAPHLWGMYRSVAFSDALDPNFRPILLQSIRC